MTNVPDLISLARTQQGVISRDQALGYGASPYVIRRRLASARWTAPAPGVYLLEGAPPGRFQELWIAHLALGPTSVVSHEAAAQIRGLPGIAKGILSMTDVHGRHQHLQGSLPTMHLHHTRLMDRIETSIVAGLPVTTVRQTIIDLAAGVGTARLATAVDHARTHRLASYEEVAQQLLVFRGTRRRGLRRLGAVLAERLSGVAVGDTELEKRLLHIIRQSGLPAPLAQIPLPGRGALAGLCDFGYPDARLVLEADGRPWHTRIADIRRDHQRDMEAAAVGWMTQRVMYEDMVGDADGVRRLIAAIYADRIALLRAAS